MFEGVKSDVIYSAKYDENCNIGTTYLGASRMRRQDELKAEHKTPITEDCSIHCKLLDGPGCKILLKQVSHLCLEHSI